MNGKYVAIAAGLLFGLNGACVAATPVAQGVINFTGSIVESPCTPSTQAGALNLSDCPAQVRGTRIGLQRVDSQASVSAPDQTPVNVRLVADSGKAGRYYHQQYALVDATGKAVSSGAYLITLTTP
ncbi:type 1 fimbrial protein [Pseudomonas sp. SBB6]|uniref:type 1 fimbrial protein n=1 Tax=Pseudomonas sp. SBB6 TaxID=2962032 RepID=UPI0020B7C1D8|nr:type 1 fimbrial protein [Pseudomonas sp. SBB6]MCP3749519.1 type 1 fimbrial protein [Pseudomonas sp. SBB6]